MYDYHLTGLVVAGPVLDQRSDHLTLPLPPSPSSFHHTCELAGIWGHIYTKSASEQNTQNVSSFNPFYSCEITAWRENKTTLLEVTCCKKACVSGDGGSHAFRPVFRGGVGRLTKVLKTFMCCLDRNLNIGNFYYLRMLAGEMLILSPGRPCVIGVGFQNLRS